ncbi:MAG: DUF881 domain-containing protein [Actinomycetaceae bacterium]|nr:DUF881 domain-containing protein [Actinomycetaceae bacterium]
MADEVKEEKATDPAASMSLLQALLYDPLNYGFSSVSDRRETRMGPLGTLIVLVLAATLSFGATAAAKTLISQKSAHEQAVSNLREQVARQQQVVKSIEVENSEITAEIALLSSDQRGSVVSKEPALQIAQQNAIHGPGIRVMVTEREGADALERVLDTDLRFIINALWAGGAEGVELNGIRVGPTTAVRTAGSTILVNFEPVVAPYEIRAIGNLDDMERQLKTGVVGAYLSTLNSKYGIGTAIGAEADIVLRPANNRNTTLTNLVQEQ